MLAFPYETHEKPPAPYLDVGIGPYHPDATTVPWKAKLDSGASLTIIPADLVRILALEPVGLVYVRGYDTQLTARFAYRANLVIGSRRFEALRVTTAPRKNILLGRDVMNQLLITLDGHQLTLTVHDA
jgi:hypothetical protein